jgi:muramoyltetrapeptide carboxypeptidase LdcA involved in peptidoglycan recycling
VILTINPRRTDGTMREFSYPAKPQAGDRVAVLSPSSGLPAVFPEVFELGLRRLREDFDLEPVEFPTTRTMGASPQDRARDIHAAFADPGITAVLASIGGDDQIEVVPYLDLDVLHSNPKPFFGYSDNTNLLNVLWNLGIVSYQGGSIMVQFGRGGRMHPATDASLRAALFTQGEFELSPAGDYTDEDRDWSDPAWLADEPTMSPGDGWSWHGPSRTVTGPLWGGCLDVIDVIVRAGGRLRSPDEYTGTVLHIETSEEMLPASQVRDILRRLGELGMLEQFAAVLVARPKAWSFEQPLSARSKETYVIEQSEAVLQTLDECHLDIPVVMGLDIGHTDPQLVMPNGGQVTVDAAARRILVTY